VSTPAEVGPGGHPHVARRGWNTSRVLFVRGVALVHVCAFVSLGVQIEGLIGEDGILPAARWAEQVLALPGASWLWPVPSLVLLDPSDGMLQALWIVGAAAAAVACIGFVPGPALAVAFVCALSLTGAGQVFLGYQWDRLLLEAGFLALLAADWGGRLGARPVPSLVRWLVLWLLFRLMFFAGFVKLESGDPAWRGLEALSFHWWTQPLPTWTAWWAEQLPEACDAFAALATLGIELALPWLIPLGRTPRAVAASGVLLLQATIAATGNYGFFNLLTVVLCLPLLDDGQWSALGRALGRLRGGGAAAWSGAPPPQGPGTGAAARAGRWLRLAVSGAVLAVTLPVAAIQAGLVDRVPPPLSEAVDLAGRYGIVGRYGLFAVMTTSRPEIQLEGTRDGEHWQPYVFRWKPGPLDRRPGFTGPHMPRLDWQMWFAALGPPRRAPWIYAFVRHLLRGTPAVTSLLAHDPFAGAPPRAVRARLFQYRFATPEARRREGAWWRREPAGTWLPPLSLTTHGGEIRP